MKITILVDNPGSWIAPFAKKLKELLQERGHKVVSCQDPFKIPQGECAFFLSCEKIVPKSILMRNKHNLVVHESALPRGKGFSPLTWQILEGRNKIPITLFEATEKVDSGKIYLQDAMTFEDHELIEELRDVQGEKTISLILKFIDSYPPRRIKQQKGRESFYRRRASDDSELNINKSIKTLFNTFRVVDNNRYPAFFLYRGHKYILRINKCE